MLSAAVSIVCTCPLHINRIFMHSTLHFEIREADRGDYWLGVTSRPLECGSDERAFLSFALSLEHNFQHDGRHHQNTKEPHQKYHSAAQEA